MKAKRPSTVSKLNGRVIFENTNEPIWTEAMVDAARLAKQTRRRLTKMGEMGMFSGMMYCAYCGSIMYQCRATRFLRDQEYYICSEYRKGKDVCGQTHSIRTVILEELILANLREFVSFARQNKGQFFQMVMDMDLRERNKGLANEQASLKNQVLLLHDEIEVVERKSTADSK